MASMGTAGFFFSIDFRDQAAIGAIDDGAACRFDVAVTDAASVSR